MKKLVWAVFFLILGLSLGFKLRGLQRGGKQPQDTAFVKSTAVNMRDTFWTVDTQRVRVPNLVFMAKGENAAVTMPDEPDEEGDTVTFDELVYSDSTYTAWVSGFCASLDSIEVYPRVTVIRDSTVVERYFRIDAKKKRWHIGPSVGIGLGPDCKVSPYIGITLTYSFTAF